MLDSILKVVVFVLFIIFLIVMAKIIKNIDLINERARVHGDFFEALKEVLFEKK